MRWDQRFAAFVVGSYYLMAGVVITSLGWKLFSAILNAGFLGRSR